MPEGLDWVENIGDQVTIWQPVDDSQESVWTPVDDAQESVWTEIPT